MLLYQSKTVDSSKEIENLKKTLVKKDISTIFAVRKTTCRVGQEVKTPPFHGGITGSSPVRGTNIYSYGMSLFIS